MHQTWDLERKYDDILYPMMTRYDCIAQILSLSSNPRPPYCIDRSSPFALVYTPSILLTISRSEVSAMYTAMLLMYIDS